MTGMLQTQPEYIHCCKIQESPIEMMYRSDKTFTLCVTWSKISPSVDSQGLR